MSEKNNSIQELLGQTDIYLVDQIMKNRFDLQNNILDAGCGNGRNMHWFLRNDYKIYGITPLLVFNNKEHTDFRL